MIATIIGIILVAAFFVSFIKFRLSIERAYSQKLAIRNCFQHFADTMCEIGPNEESLRHFWQFTQPTTAVFVSYRAAHLRRALYDNAQFLLEVKCQPTQLHKYYTVDEVSERRRKTEQWFTEQANGGIDIVLKDEMIENASIKSTLRLMLMALADAIRS